VLSLMMTTLDFPHKFPLCTETNMNTGYLKQGNMPLASTDSLTDVISFNKEMKGLHVL